MSLLFKSNGLTLYLTLTLGTGMFAGTNPDIGPVREY